jgi:hypothetical protein
MAPDWAAIRQANSRRVVAESAPRATTTLHCAQYAGSSASMMRRALVRVARKPSQLPWVAACCRWTAS